MNSNDSTPDERRRRFAALREAHPELVTGTELVEQIRGLAQEEPFELPSVEPTTVLALLIRRQRHMRHVNRFVSRENRAALRELGLKQAEIEKLLTPDLTGRLGYSDSALKANARAIRRIRRQNRL